VSVGPELLAGSISQGIVRALGDCSYHQNQALKDSV
jgi:hypothetical protein